MTQSRRPELHENHPSTSDNASYACKKERVKVRKQKETGDISWLPQPRGGVHFSNTVLTPLAKVFGRLKSQMIRWQSSGWAV